METSSKIDVLVIGGGASGLMAAIGAARQGKEVLVAEKMKKPGLKILASGGERCNVTNALDQKTYMESFGKQGRFMLPALELLGSEKLRKLFAGFGIETTCKDGFRYFPSSHDSNTVLEGLLNEVRKLDINLALNHPVTQISKLDSGYEVVAGGRLWVADRIVMATGGLTAPVLGTTGDGYQFAETLGHNVSDRFPGGVPIRTREVWPGSCRADTIGKAKLSVALKKHRGISQVGDVIFTSYGIAGPVVLDMSRELTPLIAKYGELPLTLNLRPQMNQQTWQDLFRSWRKERFGAVRVVDLIAKKIPLSIVRALVGEVGLDHELTLKNILPSEVDCLAKILTATPLTATDSMGYRLAFVTRGGVKLKGICSETLESKSQPGPHFCGEVLDLDGPCGGYNLQWAFASGYLAGVSAGNGISH